MPRGRGMVGVGALLCTGLPLDHLDRPHRSVIGFRQLLGLIATGFGLMLLVAPDRLHHWFGVGDPYGRFSVIVGTFLVVTALFLPDVTAGERQVHRHVAT